MQQPLPTAVSLALDAATELGFTVQILDPEYGYLFEIRDGANRRIMLGGKSPLNDAVASRIAEDKFYSGLLLSQAGFRIPETVRCISPTNPSMRSYRDRAGAGNAMSLAKRRGFPLIVKPNSLSHSRGVTLVQSVDEMQEALNYAWSMDRLALVQEAVIGIDVRLDFVDDAYLIGYRRKPLIINGDGVQNIRQLLLKTDVRFENEDHWNRLWAYPEFRTAMDQRQWTAETIPRTDEHLSFDGPIRNLNGPSSGEIIRSIPPALHQHCLAIGQCIGLRHFGLDMKMSTLQSDPTEATVIEVNASPLLNQMFKMGYEIEARAAQVKVIQAAMQQAVNA